MYIGPDEVLLALDVEFRAELSAEEIAQAVRDIERSIRDRFARVRRIYIEAITDRASQR